MTKPGLNFVRIRESIARIPSQNTRVIKHVSDQSEKKTPTVFTVSVSVPPTRYKPLQISPTLFSTTSIRDEPHDRRAYPGHKLPMSFH